MTRTNQIKAETQYSTTMTGNINFQQAIKEHKAEQIKQYVLQLDSDLLDSLLSQLHELQL